MPHEDHNSDSEANDVAEELVMCRTDHVQITTNLKEIEDMTVIDQWGRKVRFGDFYMKQQTIVIFIRVSTCINSLSTLHCILFTILVHSMHPFTLFCIAILFCSISCVSSVRSMLMVCNKCCICFVYIHTGTGYRLNII